MPCPKVGLKLETQSPMGQNARRQAAPASEVPPGLASAMRYLRSGPSGTASRSRSAMSGIGSAAA
jgi:hypothetical protein